MQVNSELRVASYICNFCSKIESEKALIL